MRTQLPTWSDEDFRLVFGFLEDVRGALEAPPDFLDAGIRQLLIKEASQARDRLRNIADAVCASVAG